VADTHDKLALLAHCVDEFHGDKAGFVGFAELAGSAIKSTTKSVTLEDKKTCHAEFKMRTSGSYWRHLAHKQEGP